MRDFYNNPANLSLATKDTDVSSADSMDFGAIPSGSRFSQHQTGFSDPEAVMCFQLTADCASGDDFIPYIEESADGSSWVKCITGKQVGAPASAGKVYPLPLPKNHARYLRPGATPKSTGTFAARTLQAWIGHGEQVL
ncbi:MAG TPA: hypothetical protein PLB91_06955 [Spirochaetales bacterium]|nr:hypothetical protein [Spirochaetales bacterium]HRY53001.1 hypothetical protein [Spirochaetia bacterium]